MSVLAILKKSYKEIYDRLFLVVAMSMLWFFTAGLLLVFGSFFLYYGYIIPAIAAAFLAGPITGSCFYLINRDINCESTNLVDLLKGIRKFYFKFLLLSWAIALLAYSLGFYIYQFITSGNILLNILAGVWLYLLFLLLLISFYIVPILIEFERADKDTSFKKLIKTTLLLLSRELRFTLLVFLNSILLSLLVFVLVMPIAIVFLGAIALFANNAVIKLLIEYDFREDINDSFSFAK